MAEMNCDHGTFSCIDECKGIVHKQEEIVLTDYDMGRRDQRRAVDKLHRYVRILLGRVGAGAVVSWWIDSGVCAFGAAVLTATFVMSRRYVTDLRINTVDVEFSVGWTWTGLIIFLVALIASFITCCIGELVNENHEHQY